MRSLCRFHVIACALIGMASIAWALAGESPLAKGFDASPLAGTKPLTMKGDIASDLVSAAHKFLLRETEKAVAGRDRYWNRDFSSPADFDQALEPNRKRLAHILGVR